MDSGQSTYDRPEFAARIEEAWLRRDSQARTLKRFDEEEEVVSEADRYRREAAWIYGARCC